jgi:hypothetical protein
MTLFPDVITHNYASARGIGRNICNLPDAEAERILTDIQAVAGRQMSANYLKRRRVIEDWLIAERRSKLGKTRLDRPIYFFLGDFADGKDSSRPESLVMPLTAFEAETLTFTYPDSMASLPLATKHEHLSYRKEYHGQVFTLSEIKEVVAKVGMPANRPKNDPTPVYDKFIEAQVWDDRPIKRYLAQQTFLAR